MEFSNKGLYVARLDAKLPYHSGVTRKIEMQRNALEQIGSKFDVMSLYDGSIYINNKLNLEAKEWHTKKRVFYYDFYKRLQMIAHNYHYIYIRNQRSSLFLNNCLKHIKIHCPNSVILVEFPTWPVDNISNNIRGRLNSISDSFWRGRMVENIDGIVTFSKHEKILNIKTIQTDNGIDPEKFPVLNNRFDSDEIKLLGLANLSHWHGYDRVIDGLAIHKSKGGSLVTFDIVGEGAELPKLKGLVKKRGLSDIVTFWGHLSGNQLDTVISNCHFGVGAIGMHRIGMSYSSALKAREFCVRGLPFMISHEDRDFPVDFPYSLQVSDTDEPIPIEEIVRFLRNLSLDIPDYPQKMNRYANENLTWVQKMKPVVDALRAQTQSR